MRLRFGKILKHNKNESQTEINLLILGVCYVLESDKNVSSVWAFLKDYLSLIWKSEVKIDKKVHLKFTKTKPL